MKKVLLVVVLLVCFVVSSVYAELKKEAQKFKVIYSITYNAVTMEEAARLEKTIREKFEDACSLDISTKSIDSDTQIIRYWSPSVTAR